MHARTGPSQAAPSIIFGKQKAAGSWADLKKPLVIFHKVEGNPCHYEGARASLRAEPATRMVALTRLTTIAPTAPPSPPLPSSRCREAKARLQGAAQAHHAHCCHPQEDST